MSHCERQAPTSGSQIMTSSSTLSSNYRLYIPKVVRERIGMRPGQKIAFLVKAEGVLMVPIPGREALAGMAYGANPNGHRDRKDRF